MPALDDAARDYGGVSLDDPDIVVVHLLLYGPGLDAPTVDEARRWAEHYRLDGRPGHVVLVGDARMHSPATYAMVPGLQVVDRSFRLRYDGAGSSARHDLWREVLPGLRGVLAEG